MNPDVPLTCRVIELDRLAANQHMRTKPEFG